MVGPRDLPACVWIAPVVVLGGILVLLGFAPRWVELFGVTVGTYGLLTTVLVGSVLLSLRPYL